jgi:hypothetical protein
VASTWPAIQHFRSSFVADGSPGYGEAGAGDHLQTAYHLWLVGHQIEHGRAPWRDPYSFRPEDDAQLNLAGWPFGLVYWPLDAAFGTVVAWNLFVLLGFVGAGGCTLLWLRELGLARGPALVGGLAFAIAPYRVLQSGGGHLLAMVALLLPLSLWAVERARRGSAWWLLLAGAAIASIPLSGQVHLALGAVPFFALYAAVRLRGAWRLGAAALGVAAAIGAGLFVDRALIAHSIASGGRTLQQVTFYSADWLDFVTRHRRHGSEGFVFLGWATPVLALAGLVLLARRRSPLALVLGIGAAIPLLLALGTNLPLYSAVWHVFPPLRFPRVPERLLPVACLAIAALVAFAVAGIRWRFAPLVAAALLLVDLHVDVLRATAADQGNRAYAALRQSPDEGRLVELPYFLPGQYRGSVYQYYGMQLPRQRPGGYSTVAPWPAESVARTLERMNCGDWSGGVAATLRGLGVGAALFHHGLYVHDHAVPDTSWLAWRALEQHGYRPLETDGAVTAFVRGTGRRSPPFPEPSRAEALFCQNWYPPDGNGRQMDETHSALWLYGDRSARLFLSSEQPVAVRVAVDGRPATTGTYGPALTQVKVPLHGRGWHLVTFDADHLFDLGGASRGVRVVAYSVT